MELFNEMVIADLPAILCLVVGFILIVVEMYVPGFGAPGIIGGIMLISGVALWAETPLEAFVIVIVVVALLCVALSISIHSASKGKLAQSKLILREVSVKDTQAQEIGEVDLHYYVGREGVARTVLRPSGIGEIEGVKLNVVSEGEYIEKDAVICVASVEGNRIVVEKVNQG